MASTGKSRPNVAAPLSSIGLEVLLSTVQVGIHCTTQCFCSSICCWHCELKESATLLFKKIQFTENRQMKNNLYKILPSIFCQNARFEEKFHMDTVISNIVLIMFYVCRFLIYRVQMLTAPYIFFRSLRTFWLLVSEIKGWSLAVVWLWQCHVEHVSKTVKDEIKRINTIEKIRNFHCNLELYFNSTHLHFAKDTAIIKYIFFLSQNFTGEISLTFRSEETSKTRALAYKCPRKKTGHFAFESCEGHFDDRWYNFNMI